ncbi:MAG: hypothetical protein ABIA92_05010 [Patescibacteria group bacterium]
MPTKPPITSAGTDTDVLRCALQSILTGDAEAIKQARKDLDRIRAPRGRRHSAFDRVLLDAFDTLPKYDARHQAAFLSSIGPVSLRLMGRKQEYFFGEILRYVQHPSGTVRQGALSLSRWWRLGTHIKRENTADDFARIRNFLLRIRKCITEQRPKSLPADEPVYLNELKPSVYKSLLMLWEDCVRNPYMQEFLAKDEELWDDLPVRNYNDESWLEENEIEFDDVAADLWGGHAPDKRVCAAMEELERMSIDRLGTSIAALGFSPGETTALIDKLANSDLALDQGEVLFQQFAFTCIAKGIDPDNMNDAVRAYQAAANHIVWKNQLDQPVSYLLVNCALMREEYGRTAPKDIGKLAVLLCDSHRSIDEYIDEQSHVPSCPPEFSDELWRELESEFADIHLQRKAGLIQIQSIAHHVIDWYFQLEPWSVQRYSPRQHAALALYIVKRINEDNDIYIALFSNTDLASLGGWKSMNSYSSLYYAIKHGVRDPSLLYCQGETDR